jgi:hypothetical protein
MTTFDEWIEAGMSNDWIGPPLCSTHDGIPCTAEEEEIFERGYDPCIPILRLYDSTQIREQVEENHSPSLWRKKTL